MDYTPYSITSIIIKSIMILSTISIQLSYLLQYDEWEIVIPYLFFICSRIMINLCELIILITDSMIFINKSYPKISIFIRELTTEHNRLTKTLKSYLNIIYVTIIFITVTVNNLFCATQILSHLYDKLELSFYDYYYIIYCSYSILCFVLILFYSFLDRNHSMGEKILIYADRAKCMTKFIIFFHNYICGLQYMNVNFDNPLLLMNVSLLEYGDVETQSDICPICLNNELHDQWVKLACNHKIHVSCMKNLMDANFNKCPMCQTLIN